jgi:hypothetical protein
MPHATVKIGGLPVDLILGSGATVNVLDNETFSKIMANSLIALSKTLFPYGSSTSLNIQGSYTAQVSHKDLIRMPVSSLLRIKSLVHFWATKLQLILGLFQEHENLHPIQNIYVMEITCSCKHLRMLPGIREFGIGKLNDFQLQLPVDKSLPPVAQAPCRILFHILKAVQTKLDELETLGIIEPVKGPTLWVSPPVAVPKPNGDIRVCVDMRQANSAIIRERHPILTIEETLQKLQGATIFSKLDLRSGCYQIELHPESRPITTFATQKGLYQYTFIRLYTSICLVSAPGIYQHIIQQIYNIYKDLLAYETCPMISLFSVKPKTNTIRTLTMLSKDYKNRVLP